MAARTKSRKPKTKAGAWFVAVRGSYLPANLAGWLTYLPFTAYLIFTLVVGIEKTSSLVIAVLFIVPNWVAAATVMTFIAARKS